MPGGAGALRRPRGSGPGNTHAADGRVLNLRDREAFSLQFGPAGSISLAWVRTGLGSAIELLATSFPSLRQGNLGDDSERAAIRHAGGIGATAKHIGAPSGNAASGFGGAEIAGGAADKYDALGKGRHGG